MSRSLTLLLTLVIAASALAGCTLGGKDNDDTVVTPIVDTTPTTDPFATPPPVTPAVTPSVTPPTAPVLDTSSYGLAAAGAPGQAKPGSKFNFTLFANGTTTHASDHIGAHYANNDTAAPNASAMKACDHATGNLPGQFVVTCTLADQGTWYIYGHARITDTSQHDWWVATPLVVKVRDYTLAVSGIPTNAQTSGGNFSFQVNISGTDNVTTDHIGAHFWNASETNPTIQNAAGACAHIASGAVGNYTISCSITNPGALAPHDYYLRGHLRIVEGGTTLEWWSPEQKVTVLGSLPASPI